MIDLSRLPRKPKRVTASLNPATGEVSGAWVTLAYDWEGTLPNLGGWVEGQVRMLACYGLEVGEVSTSRTGLARTEREGEWSGSFRFGVRCASEPPPTSTQARPAPASEQEE